MTGTSAAEKETPGSRADKLHRGRNVVLAFTMQVTPSPYTHHKCVEVRQLGWVREKVRQLQRGVGLHHAGDTFTTHTTNVSRLRQSGSVRKKVGQLQCGVGCHHASTTHVSRFKQLKWARERVRQLQCGVGLYHAGQPLVRQHSAFYVCQPNSKCGVGDGESACLQLRWAAVPTHCPHHVCHMLPFFFFTMCAAWFTILRIADGLLIADCGLRIAESACLQQQDQHSVHP